MRRKLDWVAPIFLIGLLVQIFAPVAAGIAMAAASDPVRSLPICTSAGGDATHQAPADRHASDCCAFCALAHASLMSANEQPASFVAGAPVPISLDHPATILPTFRIAHFAQARAPPSLA